MTPAEIKRIEQLTGTLKPRCVGRYLIDVPIAFVLNDQSRTEIEGVTIIVTPSSQPQFTQNFERRRKNLELMRQVGQSWPHLRRIISLGPSSLGAVFDRAQSNVSGRLGRTLELLAWTNGYEVFATIEATDTTFPEDAKDSIASQLKTDVPEKLAHLLSVYERTRGRKDDEIPAEQGVCFANGFVKGPPTDKEWIDMVHHWDGAPDVYFSYHYLSDMGPQQTSLLERGKEIEAGLTRVNGNTLRKGSRHAQGLVFDEWLLQRQASYGARPMIYDYTLEINSKQGDAGKPLLVIDLTSGVKHPRLAPTLEEAAVEVPLAKASLNAQETMAVWDKVTSTLRPRPGAF